jgi:sec-independent protein translocase protein TatA
MIGDILQPTHLLFILAVALLVLGPKRLPEAGRALGGAIRDFKSAVSGEHDQPSELPTQAAAPPPATAVPVAPPVEPAAHVATVQTEQAVQAAETAQAETAETVQPLG